MGLALERLRPRSGAVKAFHERVGERLDRSLRWLQETVKVSGEIEQAIDQGVPIPLEIMDLGWREVPRALDNLRQGRPMDYKAEKEKREPTPEERAAAVRAAIKKLSDALGAIESESLRASPLTEAREALDEVDASDLLAPTEPEPPAPCPEPRAPNAEPRAPPAGARSPPPLESPPVGLPDPAAPGRPSHRRR